MAICLALTRGEVFAVRHECTHEAVPLSEGEAEEVHIDHSAEHVANGPGYDPGLEKDRAYLGGVYDHYGYGPYWEAGFTYPGFPRTARF